MVVYSGTEEQSWSSRIQVHLLILITAKSLCKTSIIRIWRILLWIKSFGLIWNGSVWMQLLNIQVILAFRSTFVEPPCIWLIVVVNHCRFYAELKRFVGSDFQCFWRDRQKYVVLITAALWAWYWFFGLYFWEEGTCSLSLCPLRTNRDKMEFGQPKKYAHQGKQKE